MDQDTIDYFKRQADAAMARHRSAQERDRASGMSHKRQWMAAACEALRTGAVFSDRATRRIAKPWDGRMTAFSV